MFKDEQEYTKFTNLLRDLTDWCSNHKIKYDMTFVYDPTYY